MLHVTYEWTRPDGAHVYYLAWWNEPPFAFVTLPELQEWARHWPIHWRVAARFYQWAGPTPFSGGV